jgi:hypothetical protein
MATKSTRYKDVYFQFLGGDGNVDLPGSVSLSDGEMTLIIPGGDGPYLIEGKGKYFFKGVNVDLNGGQVEAEWSQLSEVFVGMWIEDGFEYLFSFRLRSVTSKPRARKT